MKKLTNLFWVSAVLLAFTAFSSCSESPTDDGKTEIPEAEAPVLIASGITTTTDIEFLFAATEAKEFTITSDSSWEIATDADWFSFSDEAGEAGANTPVSIIPTINKGEERDDTFTITADNGEKTTVLEYTVTQDAFGAVTLNITGDMLADDKMEMPCSEGETTLHVNASFAWEAILEADAVGEDNDYTDWITMDQEADGAANTDIELAFTLETNPEADTRSATITIRQTDAPDGIEPVEKVIALTQAEYIDTTPVGTVFFEEDFNIITEKWNDTYTKYGWPSVEIDGDNYNEFSYTTSEELSSIFLSKFTKFSYVYCRYEGEIKLGSSKNMGYVTLPEMNIASGVKINLLVEFDAALYATPSGNLDHGDEGKFTVSTSDASTINATGESSLKIDLINGAFEWKRYSVIINNATSTTLIKLGTTNAVANRVHIDNIKVTRAEDENPTALPVADVTREFDYEVKNNTAADAFTAEGAIVGAGAELTFDMRFNRAWSATSSADWLTVGSCGCDGNANGSEVSEDNLTINALATGLPYTIVMNASENPSKSEPREATITISVNGTTIPYKFTQAPSESPFNVTGIEDNKFELSGAANATKTFTLESRKAWTITPADGDSWYTISHTSGEANQGSPLTITVSAPLNTGFRKFGGFTISTTDGGDDEPIEVTFSQQVAPIGAINWDMSEPVSWNFSVDKMAETNYDYDFAALAPEAWPTVDTNVLPAEFGPGYISFKHVYESEDGDCKRAFEAKSGEPYVTGAWPGAYWMFTVPVANVAAGTKVRFTGNSRTSGTGQKYWMFEYLDGSEWLPVVTPTTKNDSVIDKEVTFTHEHMNTDNLPVDVTVTLANAISNGNIQFRFRCVANAQANDKGALETPNGGTHRFRGEMSGAGYSPKIQIVE